MTSPILFYFDFSSPYGYLAALRIDALAARHGREVLWKPFLLGAVFKTTGGEPLLDMPMKGDYARHDIARTARLMDVPFRLPARFPFSSVAASRAFYWLHDRDPGEARAFAAAVFHAAFAQGKDVSNPEGVVDIAVGNGQDGEAVRAALQDQALKDRLKREVDAALEAKVFGSPYVLVDGEPFWGQDRLDQLDKWLETGGW